MKNFLKLFTIAALCSIGFLTQAEAVQPQPAPKAEAVIQAPAPTQDASALLFSMSAPLLLGMLNVRTLKDLNLQSIKALPAAAATSYGTAIDTAFVNPGRLTEVEFFISVPATPNLANASTISLVLQDSADNVTFANVADVPAQTLTGAGGVGAAAFTYQAKLPINCRRYLRLSQSVSAAGGDSTAISTTLGLVF